MKRFKEYLKEDEESNSSREYAWHISSSVFGLHKVKPKTEYLVSHYKKLPSGNHSSVANTDYLKGHEFINKLKNKEYPSGRFALNPSKDVIKNLQSFGKRK